MPLISINILTKNRAELLTKALDSVRAQTFNNYEVVVVNDGSTDNTAEILKDYEEKLPLKIITHAESKGIVASRQEALEKSLGEFVAVLDDDDRWLDRDKISKQLAWFGQNPKGVLVGGAVECGKIMTRPATDGMIRETMLLRNNFFTSTVMFKTAAAFEVGGFVSDGVDLAEDYDLWLRMGQIGQMGNFSQLFTAYRAPRYNKDKLKLFYKKQLNLIAKYRRNYAYYWLSSLILKLRIYV